MLLSDLPRDSPSYWLVWTICIVFVHLLIEWYNVEVILSYRILIFISCISSVIFFYINKEKKMILNLREIYIQYTRLTVCLNSNRLTPNTNVLEKDNVINVERETVWLVIILFQTQTYAGHCKPDYILFVSNSTYSLLGK